MNMNMIVVVDDNWNIGWKGKLLVHLPGDLAYFKKTTLGKTLVMGRKTLESLPGGKPLAGRETVVLSGNKELQIPGCTVCHTKKQVLKQVAGKDVFIAGGEKIYRLFLEDCHTFFVTRIYDTFPADCPFPNLDQRADMEVMWQSRIREEQDLRYRFFIYKRI